MMADQLALLPGYLTAHLQLTLVALLLGAALSVPLGVWITRRASLEQAVLGAASVIQTIPSLALLAIMVPALGVIGTFTAAAFGVELRSIGYTPAIAALFLYSILPILRNTVTGIAGVDDALIEAARGVGMTERQQLRRVELPLAMPVIVAGLRTSAVWVVGTATLSTPVGATSLGNYIFSGLQTRNHTAVLVGCVAAAGLAILLDQLIHALELGVRRRRRGVVAGSLSVLVALYAFTGLTFAAQRLGGPQRLIAVGSKTFTEQYILSEIIEQRIADQAGLPVRSVPSLGSTVAFDALRTGDLDVYVDYSGTIWATIMKRETLPGSRDRVLGAVTRFLQDEHGITLLGSLGFENTYALGMRRARAGPLGVARISELAAVSRQLEIGGDYEFFQRPEWASLVRTYGLDFRAERSMDSSLMYQAVATGEVDVISAFSTDGRIAAFDIELLEDDRGVIPPYDAILLLSPRVSRENPEVAAALGGLVGSIDTVAMRRMNLAVDREGRSPADVAREFLEGLPGRGGSRSR
jgi:osmoprotectant transport system permease protein